MSGGAGLAGALIAAIAMLAGGVVTAVVNWLIKRQDRPVGAATARKTEADTVAVEVSIARDLLQEVKIHFTDRLAEQAAVHKSETDKLRQQIADHESETGKLRQQIADLSARMQHFEQQTQAIRAAYLLHQEWDRQAWRLTRETNPDFPPPPPIDGVT